MAKRRSRAVTPKRTPVLRSTRKAISRTAEFRARSLAAKKGWRTRHAEQKRRSDSARKGWRTRERQLRAVQAEQSKRRRSRVRPVPTTKRTTPKRARGGKPGKRLPQRPTGGTGTTERAEFIGAADYKASRRQSSISVQISAKGPSNASAKEAERAIQEKINTGHSPKGWTVKMIDWNSPHGWNKLRAPLKAATLAIERL